MLTPYVKHVFGSEVGEKARSYRGWFSAGIATSIAWPQEDVWLTYNGDDFLIHGVPQENPQKLGPCISVPCGQDEIDAALAKMLRFASVVGWFKDGYVDVTGYVSGGRPIRYATAGGHLGMLLDGHKASFNHMPIIEDDNVRKALAFIREGRRLRHVHAGYSFLSFFKVLESQLRAQARITWIEAHLGELRGEAAARVAELRNDGADVSRHLFQSGRCAVAHASVDEMNIIDPDVPNDRRRIAADISVMQALAELYVLRDLGVPDRNETHKTRDRLRPWHAKMTAAALERLKNGGTAESAEEFHGIQGAEASVGLWPDEPVPELSALTAEVVETAAGGIKVALINARQTIVLMFWLDIMNGKAHALLEESGLTKEFNPLLEAELYAFHFYFHSAIGNGNVEIRLLGCEPVDCEIIIPRNIMPRNPLNAANEALERFRAENAGAEGPANAG